MPDVSDQDLIEMKRLFRACVTQFRRYERGELAKLEGQPLSIVEAQQAQQAADMNAKFAAACEVYAAPPESPGWGTDQIDDRAQ